MWIPNCSRPARTLRESHDGLRVSARLYLPSPSLGFDGPRPIVHYIHGGPQSQERPNFTWFSTPLIQYLTLNGFAVFVSNVRGSVGYGQAYTKHVDRDWGGNDRLDHVAGVEHLSNAPAGPQPVRCYEAITEFFVRHLRP